MRRFTNCCADPSPPADESASHASLLQSLLSVSAWRLTRCHRRRERRRCVPGFCQRIARDRYRSGLNNRIIYYLHFEKIWIRSVDVLDQVVCNGKPSLLAVCWLVFGGAVDHSRVAYCRILTASITQQYLSFFRSYCSWGGWGWSIGEEASYQGNLLFDESLLFSQWVVLLIHNSRPADSY